MRTVKQVSFAVDKVSLIEEVNKSQFARVRIEAFASGDNHHNLPVSEETLKRTAHTLYDKPLVWIYNKFTNDIDGHSPDEIPCGFIHRENNEIKFERHEDGRLFLVVEAMIWKKYSNGILKFFERDGMEKPVSVELEILNFAEEDDDGKTEILDLCYQAVTILGTYVSPAIPKARAEIIEFSKAKREYEKIFSTSVEKLKLTDSNFQQFDYEYAMNLKANHPDIWNRGGNVSGNTAFELWSKARNGSKSQTVLSWISEREQWANRHKNDKSFSDIIASVKYGVVVSRGEQFMKELIDKEIQKKDEGDDVKYSVKEELGKSPAIDIDNNKESAIMSGSWSDPGAGLLDKLLKASNHKSLVNEAYLIVDGDAGGDLSVNDVHYPHHKVKGGKLVAHKRGVQSAYARARQQGLSGDAMSHIEKHYKELGLNTEHFEEDGKMAKKDMIAKMSAQVDADKFAVLDFDENFAYALNKEDKKFVAIPYAIEKKEDSEEEDDEVKMAMDGMKKAKMGCKYAVVEEDDEEDDEEYMSVFALIGMSSDANTEGVAVEKQNEEDAEADKKKVEDEDNLKAAKVTAEMEALMAENEDLKKFKSEVEMARDNAQFEATVAEISEFVNEEKLVEIKAKRADFESVETWVNFAKALAFEFAKGKKDKKEPHVKAAFAFTDDSTTPKSKWDKY